MYAYQFLLLDNPIFSQYNTNRCSITKGGNQMENRQYLCIDQRSFYATVECVARGLDPLDADLVVADAERSENTIC